MSRTFFDRNHNLHIGGDVNVFSISGSGQDDHEDYLQVTQRVQATNAHSRTLKQGLKILCNYTAPSARYESDHSFTGPRCHPGTRLAVQDHIVKWLDDEDGPMAMWINGPVGIGKSAIARTVADLAAVRKQLSSAFFFFRSDEARNSTKHLVATLAYEMTQQMPYILESVCTAIASNPLIFSSPLERQISTTLLQPLSTPSAASLQVHKLIIIDGLDECLDTNIQVTVIRSFILGLLSVSAEIIPHRILIVSRTESHITSAFAAPDISCHVKHLALESWDTEDDIGTFLRAKLDDIRQTHPLRHYLPDVWPDDSSFRRLRQQSIGSFAYASVVIRHLASHKHSPERALQDILCLRPSRAAAAFADLDVLYRHILLSLDSEMLFLLQKILCLYVYALCDAINDLAEFLSEDKFTVEIALIQTSSLIQIDDSEEIKFHHSSFEEFLLDKDRSGDLYVFCPNVAGAAATALSRLWLQPMDRLYHTFESMSQPRSDNCERSIEDMHVYIAKALVATKLPNSFYYDTPCGLEDMPFKPSQAVANFFWLVQWKSHQRNSEHMSTYDQAFTVICEWLRSQFYRFFEGAPTPKAILDILLEDGTKPLRRSYPFMDIFRHLSREGGVPFYYLHRVFPEMNRLEIYSGILDRYQTGLLWFTDFSGQNTDPARKNIPHPFKGLYSELCRCVKLPEFSQRLEQMVLEGMKALGLVPDVYQYVSPRDCIFRFLYGPSCYLDSNYQLATRDKHDIVRSSENAKYLSIADKTSRYIQLAHWEHDFSYLSQEVEALCRATSPAPYDILLWMERDHDTWD